MTKKEKEAAKAAELVKKLEELGQRDLTLPQGDDMNVDLNDDELNLCLEADVDPSEITALVKEKGIMTLSAAVVGVLEARAAAAADAGKETKPPEKKEQPSVPVLVRERGGFRLYRAEGLFIIRDKAGQLVCTEEKDVLAEKMLDDLCRHTT